jgi:1-acyl-sn-glycerol-3-phosphate acyltransferase
MKISERPSVSTVLRAGCIALSTAWFGLIALIVSVFESSGRRQHRIARAWASSVLRFAGCPITVVGAEHLPTRPSRKWGQKVPRPAPAVYACNHLSYFDTPALFASLRFQFRILAKSGLFKIPFLGWYLRRSGQVAVELGNTHASLRSLNAGVKTLKHGLPLVIFPEGGRSPDGQLHTFLSGMAYMAVRAKVPIVPMALVGTYETMPMHSYHIRPRPFLLAVGEPISVESYSIRELDQLTAKVFDAISHLYIEHSPVEA